jgi:WD40 repeat protein/tRNA A-37 threonylcarbamoyl transferase component Bud32/DNA-directed RNA polymerase subunit RPC12/RpoP
LPFERALTIILLAHLLALNSFCPLVSTQEDTSRQLPQTSPFWSYETRSAVLTVGISSDGQHVAAGSEDGSVYFFNRDSEMPTWAYRTNGSVLSVAISSDGQYIAAGSSDHRVYLFSRDGGTPLWSYTTMGNVSSVAISSDGRYIAAGGLSAGIYFFSRDSDQPLWRNPLTTVVSVAISSDGSHVVVADDTYGGGYVFNGHSAIPQSYLEANFPISIAISSDGQYIVAGSPAWMGVVYNEVSIYHYLESGFNLIGPYPHTREPGDAVSIAVSSDAEYIAVGSSGSSIFLFKRSSESDWPAWSYKTGGAVASVAISSDGRYIAGGSSDNAVYFFNNDGGVPSWTYQTGNRVRSVAISSDGGYIVAGSSDNRVYLFSREIPCTMTVSYSIAGGGAGYSAPIFNYVQGGVDKQHVLTETPTAIPVDSGSRWSVATNALAGSGASERWYSNQTLSGTAPTLSIVFKYQHQYYLTMQVPSSGSITPDSGWQNAGLSLQIAATANQSYIFRNWLGSGSGSYTGTNNPATLVMNSPITETANFTVLPVAVPGVSSGAVGSIALATVAVISPVIGLLILERRKRRDSPRSDMREELAGSQVLAPLESAEPKAKVAQAVQVIPPQARPVPSVRVAAPVAPSAPVSVPLGMCFYHSSVPAMYVCSRCGRAVCRDDYKAYMGLVLCMQCYAGIVPSVGPQHRGPAHYAPPREFQQGDSIPIYEWPGQQYLVDHVYRGGMSVVYKCREIDRPELVIAIKALRPDLVAEPEVRRRFEREAESWINLGEHKNIVKAYFLTKIADLPYLVLEYVDGGDLRRIVRDRVFSFKQVVACCLQICDGMIYAHTKKLGHGKIGLLHRDLKPENILIRSTDNLVKITDFGLARAIQGSSQSRDIAGTWHYMAPEQFTDPENLDQRTDVYSFGVLFYELVTGHLPYPRPNILGNLPLPPIRQYIPSAPGAAEFVLQQCLKQDREARLADFRELKSLLESLDRATSR